MPSHLKSEPWHRFPEGGIPLSFMLDLDGNKRECTQHVTRYSLTRAEVGPLAKPLRGKGTSSRWNYRWHVECQPRVGWSPRYVAQGDAKSLLHAKQCANAAIAIFVNLSAPNTKAK